MYLEALLRLGAFYPETLLNKRKKKRRLEYFSRFRSFAWRIASSNVRTYAFAWKLNLMGGYLPRTDNLCKRLRFLMEADKYLE